jgi:hypothetical protein
LFDLVVKDLSVLFQRASAISYYRDIEYSHEDYINHLQYADDTLIFIPNYYHSLLHVKWILRWFDLCSDLKVDFSESSLLGINLDDVYIIGMTNEIVCRWDFLPFIHLSLPLGANPRGIST